MNIEKSKSVQGERLQYTHMCAKMSIMSVDTTVKNVNPCNIYWICITRVNDAIFVRNTKPPGKIITSCAALNADNGYIYNAIKSMDCRLKAIGVLTCDIDLLTE